MDLKLKSKQLKLYIEDEESTDCHLSADSELRRALQKLGYSPGPITTTTRLVYENRLSILLDDCQSFNKQRALLQGLKRLGITIAVPMTAPPLKLDEKELRILMSMPKQEELKKKDEAMKKETVGRASAETLPCGVKLSHERSNSCGATLESSGSSTKTKRNKSSLSESATLNKKDTTGTRAKMASHKYAPEAKNKDVVPTALKKDLHRTSGTIVKTYPVGNDQKIQSLLHGASVALKAETPNFSAAKTSYNEALVLFKTGKHHISDTGLLMIKYCYAQSLSETPTADYNDLEKTKALLEEMQYLVKTKSLSFPLIHLGTARFYTKLFLFDKAEGELITARDQNTFEVQLYPGTNYAYPLSIKENYFLELDKIADSWKWQEKWNALCRNPNCNQESPKIYVQSPIFQGYVELICDQNCVVAFHLDCWKSIQATVYGVGKSKDILHQQCYTPDCDGNNSQLTTYNRGGDVKYRVGESVDKKQTQKKERKKSGIQQNQAKQEHTRKGSKTKNLSGLRAKCDDGQIPPSTPDSRKGSKTHDDDDDDDGGTDIDSNLTTPTQCSGSKGTDEVRTNVEENSTESYQYLINGDRGKKTPRAYFYALRATDKSKNKLQKAKKTWLQEKKYELKQEQKTSLPRTKDNSASDTIDDGQMPPLTSESSENSTSYQEYHLLNDSNLIPSTSADYGSHDAHEHSQPTIIITGSYTKCSLETDGGSVAAITKKSRKKKSNNKKQTLTLDQVLGDDMPRISDAPSGSSTFDRPHSNYVAGSIAQKIINSHKRIQQILTTSVPSLSGGSEPRPLQPQAICSDFPSELLPTTEVDERQPSASNAQPLQKPLTRWDNDITKNTTKPQCSGGLILRSAADKVKEVVRESQTSSDGLIKMASEDRQPKSLADVSSFITGKTTATTGDDTSIILKAFAQKQETKDRCPICWDALARGVTTAACKKHRFHEVCLQEWLRHKQVCPLCKRFLVNELAFPQL